mmetsp:Transcript_20592/g.50571  ORF Transcript_20592/g.50571 Transcript_20592/m.50571 type:complete len:370 (+) Transcript_20592:189-1298(+)|eukprot:CAMPEP_0113636444 /NCGR_PEP_ID=MMETSP0017_2-20120614/19027_1 /TAXON_ID=2856 /ORGANISM="Cylindrotheca closterium" /LENGTH=369 /DNA_ID=CAMNT_0000547327 /DNA_START=157 /DNA_END=1266 /DNA_ORIENTATION=- /assembly_acc=CAM_ASM_000147
MRRDEGSRRGDAIQAHLQQFCVCGVASKATLFVCLLRLMSASLALFVALTERLYLVKVFTLCLGAYQLFCFSLQLSGEERINPYASLYEFTKARYELSKVVLATFCAVVMAISLPYLAYYTDEPHWRHAGWGVLLFVLPALLDYRIRRSLCLLVQVQPENKEEDDDGAEIDFQLTSLWVGKYLLLPVEFGGLAAFALSNVLKVPQWAIAGAVFVNVASLALGILAKMSPGSCWIDGDGKLYIPINATEADLSYAGYLIASDLIVDDDVGYFAAGHVAGYIPKILHWINYAGLPQAGKWGEVLGDGDAETGCELCVEKFSSRSIMYQHMGQAYIQLGNQVFEIRGGCIENSANPILLEQAKPINGCWEVI